MSEVKDWTEMQIKEGGGSLKEMKGGKASGLEGIVMVLLNYDRISIISWLVKQEFLQRTERWRVQFHYSNILVKLLY